MKGTNKLCLAALMALATGCEQDFGIVVRQSDQQPGYSESPALYTKGSDINPNRPVNIYRTIKSYAIDSGLPQGLFFDPVTGVISGQPTVISAARTFTVTATYDGGEKTLTLAVRVRDAAPASLAYTIPTLDRYVQMAQAAPTSTGGTPTQYSVSPALPAGLSIDPVSGIISGMPQVALASTPYTVTASNETGSASATINLRVRDIAPATIAYSPNPATYPVNRAFSTAPTFTGGTPTTWSAASLPPGVTINPTTGVISGTPTQVASPMSYVITGTNESGSASVSLSLEFTEQPPTSLAYNPATLLLFKGRMMTPVTPTSTGGVPTSFTISPTLPAGLVFNATNGTISGTPTAFQAGTVYTVSGSNSRGTATANVSIAIMGALVANPSTFCLDDQQGPFGRPIALSASDESPGSATYTFAIVAAPAHGTLSAIASSGLAANLTYYSVQGFVGTDSFTFKVTDQYGRVSNVATVSVNVGNQVKTVANATDLDGVRNDLFCKYQQTVDIDLTSVSIQPIGNVTSPFRGSYDGANHTISHWDVLHVSNDYMGPFGYVDGRVSNLTLSEPAVGSTSGKVGGVAGLVSANGKLTNVTVTTSLTDTSDGSGSIHGGWEFGGIVARNQGGVISGATFNGRVGNNRIQYTDGTFDHMPKQVSSLYAGALAGSNKGTITASATGMNVFAGPVDPITLSNGGASTGPIKVTGSFSVSPTVGTNTGTLGAMGTLAGNFYYGSITAPGGFFATGYANRTYVLPNQSDAWSSAVYLRLVGVPLGSLYNPTDRTVYAGGIVGRNEAGTIMSSASYGYIYLYDMP